LFSFKCRVLSSCIGLKAELGNSSMRFAVMDND